MKTYITPNIECQDLLQGAILCNTSPNDGKGQMNKPDPDQDTHTVF